MTDANFFKLREGGPDKLVWGEFELYLLSDDGMETAWKSERQPIIVHSDATASHAITLAAALDREVRCDACMVRVWSSRSEGELIIAGPLDVEPGTSAPSGTVLSTRIAVMISEPFEEEDEE